MCLLEIRCTHVRTMCKEDVIDAVIEQSEKMMKKEKESILAESKKCLKYDFDVVPSCSGHI